MLINYSRTAAAAKYMTRKERKKVSITKGRQTNERKKEDEN